MRSILFVLIGFASFPSHAELVMADSIEWVATTADVVAEGTVAQVRPVDSEEKPPWYEVTVAVKTMLKGPPAVFQSGNPVTVTFVTRHKVAATGPVLAFVSTRDRVRLAPADKRLKWVGTGHHGTWEGPVLDLSPKNSRLRVAERNFEMLTDPAVIRAAVVKALAGAPASARGYSVDAPYQSAVHGALYGGSAVMVQIPVDAELERWAVGRLASQDVTDRYEAARALGLIPSPANTERLKRLLTDPGFWTQRQKGQTTFKLFVVRREAFKALKRQGIEVKAPVIREPASD